MNPTQLHGQPSPPTASAASEEAVNALRHFNRFFTRRIGVLEPYLGSELSLTEVRVLYELAHQEGCVATELARELGLDNGYLSRVLRRFEKQGWLQRHRNAKDARQQLLSLTESGKATFAPLEERSHQGAASLLAPLLPLQQTKLVEAMQGIERLLSPAPTPPSSPPRVVVLRDPQPGDIGWVVQMHGEVYAKEYGWDQRFEALVADIAAQFLRKFDPQWERCWIAELDGERAGAVFVVRKSATVAQLRMLILSPKARGLGLGARLTDECIAFARAKGYRKMVLWTNSCLTTARAIYARRGFQLLKSEPYEDFGHQLVGETWEMKL